MNVLLIGSGGREHALAWKIAASPRVKALLATPGSAAIAQYARCVPLEGHAAIADFAVREHIGLVVVGPEAPLVEGLADVLRAKGLAVFGPSAAAAQLEGSKAFSKAFMQRHGVPTAASETFTELNAALAYVAKATPPYVVKADGLAAGKGVIICKDRDEGKAAIRLIMADKAFGTAGGTVVVEQFLKAEDKGDRFVIHGRKWFITGADGAKHFILIARTSDDRRKGLTAFLFDREQPGWRIVRRIGIMGPEEHGGHCELEFDGLEVPRENVLLGIGDGLKVTQMRLGPARLTHCMRWLGFSKRCLEIAQAYVSNREGFGIRLADRESVQIKLGEVAQRIQIGRLLTMNAAWLLDQGSRARKEVSMAKVHVADTLHAAADTAIQLNGARGYSKDTILEWIYRAARSARLVDGATEVHMMVLARFLREEGTDFWRWGKGDS